MATNALGPRFVLALAVLAGSTACATGDGMQNKLRDASSAYNRSMRWGDFDRAAGYLPGSAQPAFLASHDEVSDELVIVDYEMTRLDLDKATGIASSRAEITWHTDRRLILETTTVDQLWQWHHGNFVLVDERRSGGKPLGIFAEPGEDVHPYLPGLAAYRELHGIGKDEKQLRKERRRSRREGQPAPAAAPTGPASAAALALDAPPEGAASGHSH